MLKVVNTGKGLHFTVNCKNLLVPHTYMLSHSYLLI